MNKIYDCFCFFNELDLLELRFNVLDDYVDHFVLLESSVTHMGQAKPYYYEDNKDRFAKWENKIIHLKIEDIPNDYVNLPPISDPDSDDGKCVNDIYRFIAEQTKRFDRRTQPHYGRDFYQKESIRRGLIGCDDNDIIISSDCDEIPNPDILKNVVTLLNSSTFLTLEQTTYYYYINLLKELNWRGSRIGRYKDLKGYSYNELRSNPHTLIANGGWHFSFMGGPEKVKTKIQSYSATEMNTGRVISNIETNMCNGIDPFFRSKLSEVPIDDSYPKYLLDNLDKYQHMVRK